MGGTEILPALEAIFQVPPRPGRTRQLFVLTDGKFQHGGSSAGRWTERRVDPGFHVRDRRGSKPAPRKGNGEGREREGGVHRSRRASRGEVLRQLERALTPACLDVAIDWGTAKVRQSPHRVPPVFPEDHLTVYGLLVGTGAYPCRLEREETGRSLRVSCRPGSCADRRGNPHLDPRRQEAHPGPRGRDEPSPRPSRVASGQGGGIDRCR